MRRLLLLLCAVLLVVAPAACASPPWTGFVRVDQVGYAPGETKIAVLLASRPDGDVRASVIGADGRTVLKPPVGAGRGRWNGGFGDVRPIDLSALTTPGIYRVRIDGPGHAESPPFRIGADLFGALARDAVGYFRAHRDGADQVAARRQPSHLTDRAATAFSTPSFDDNDLLTGELAPVAGPVDVEGGWFDAGDYLKFTHTSAYALIIMLLTHRDKLAVTGLDDEIRHGLAWLSKMAGDPLYIQVGIGSGGPGLRGDHDAWRLPEDDDRLDVSPGDDRYYQRYRPVFRAAPPGEPISPNLAGRVAAAFALAAQTEAATDRARAAEHLAVAARIFDRADTSPARLVTTRPRSFYPEDSWADDLALGAAELARAGRVLGDDRAGGWLRQAVGWAKANADVGREAGLSVYDVSTLADVELATFPAPASAPPGSAPAAASAGSASASAGPAAPPPASAPLGSASAAEPTGSAPSDAEPADVVAARGELVDAVPVLRRDLERRLDAGARVADGNPMRAAAGNGGADYAARLLGYSAMASLYRRAFADERYAAFATTQRGVVLGANGWGVSMVIGAGSTYPRCPHDQIATLTPEVIRGAVVNGPNVAARVAHLLADRQPSPCATSPALTAFNRADAQYVDDMRVSATNEPSIDFTATGLLAFALLAAGP